MRYYHLKKDIRSDQRKQVAGSILNLKKALRQSIPQKELDKNLLIATWNIRDFDSNKFGYGPRLKESFYYLGQILSAFDLIAVQEVNKNLTALEHLMFILGPDWDYITTDPTEGSGGNHERMTFIYDTRRVSFENIAGEIVLPKNKLIRGDVQFARTPFLVTFRAGWSEFSLCTVHIYFGSDTGPQLERRKSEISGIARFLKTRADKDKQTLIVLGDFNIVDQSHETMKAMLDNGFQVPEKIRNNPLGSNTFQTKHYDQIAVRSKSPLFKLGEKAGVFNYYHHIFTEEEFELFKPHVVAVLQRQQKNKEKDKARLLKSASPDQEKLDELQEAIEDLERTLANDEDLKQIYLNKWRTFQLSDHLPMWTEIMTDFSEPYLENLST